jgi:YD repeat-containing protein
MCPACGYSAAEEQKQTSRVVYAGLWFMTSLLVFLLPVAARRWYRTSADAGSGTSPTHDGAIAKLSDLHSQGSVYLVQFTPHTAAYSVEDLAHWLHQRYGVDVHTLPPEPLPKSARNMWRRQYVAELLATEMKRTHSALAADPNAVLIGLTDADIYPVSENWSSTFTQRDGRRAAVLSSATLEDEHHWWRPPANRQTAAMHLQARMRRVLLKDVALLYWHLPVNNDPSSLLQQPQDTDLPTEDLYESDLDPARTRWGQYEREPCIFFQYSATTGLHAMPGRLIRTCGEVETPQQNGSTELFQVDLRYGTMVDRRTDLVVPGSMPIAFERALSPGSPGDNPFGSSGSDGYDGYLWSKDNIFITAAGADGFGIRLVRDPIWLPFLSLVKYVDRDFSGHYYTMRWRTSPYPHYDLRRYDGEVASYLPCSSHQMCYLNGVREADGRSLTFRREVDRRLSQVTSSDGSWVKLQYGAHSRIEQASDNHGQTVRYGYNERNQLTSVRFTSGETLYYSYDEANRLTEFSASPNDHEPPKTLLRCEYQNGFLSRQTLADGSTYVYTYGPVDDRRTRTASVEAPDGMTYTMRRFGDVSGVWATATISRR